MKSSPNSALESSLPVRFCNTKGGIVRCPCRNNHMNISHSGRREAHLIRLGVYILCCTLAFGNQSGTRQSFCQRQKCLAGHKLEVLPLSRFQTCFYRSFFLNQIPQTPSRLYVLRLESHASKRMLLRGSLLPNAYLVHPWDSSLEGVH